MEKEFAPCNSEVVFAPVPELAKVLVVQGIKRIIPESRRMKTWLGRGKALFALIQTPKKNECKLSALAGHKPRGKGTFKNNLGIVSQYKSP